MKSIRERRIKRHFKVKSDILGKKHNPRLVVFRSNKHIFAQVIDDKNKGKVLASASEKELKEKGTKSEKAFLIGKLIAQKTIAQKVTKIIFDRGGYQYHGRVESLAKGAREGGLKF